MAGSKASGELWVAHLGCFLFTAVALAIFVATYDIAELTCSRGDDSCTMVRTSATKVERMSFRLSSVTSAEKIDFPRPGTALGVRTGKARHIVVHTRDGDMHLTDYDSTLSKKRMDQNVEEINAFIGNRASKTLTIRRDERLVALAALPFLFFSGVCIAIWRWMKKREEYPETAVSRDSGHRS